LEKKIEEGGIDTTKPDNHSTPRPVSSKIYSPPYHSPSVVIVCIQRRPLPVPASRKLRFPAAPLAGNHTGNTRARRLASEKSTSSHRAPYMERDVLVSEDAASAAAAASSSFAETRVICRVYVLTDPHSLPTFSSPLGLRNLRD
jgi:hypothetical protein